MTDKQWDAEIKAATETVEQAEARIKEIKQQAADAQRVLDGAFVA